MRTLVRIAAAAALAATGYVAVLSAASAAVVCNHEGDCWHTEGAYHYPRGVIMERHPDHWYFHQTWNDRRHWRDYHEGRGYWRGGVWVTF